MCVCAALACGCAARLFDHHSRSAAANATSAARAVVPAADKALVYFVRPGKQTSLRTEIACDGAPLGTNGRRRFVYAMLDPGTHVLGSRGQVPAELPIALEAGRTYYIEEKIVPTIVGIRSSLVRLDDADGRKALSRCSLSAPAR